MENIPMNLDKKDFVQEKKNDKLLEIYLPLMFFSEFHLRY